MLYYLQHSRVADAQEMRRQQTKTGVSRPNAILSMMGAYEKLMPPIQQKLWSQASNVNAQIEERRQQVGVRREFALPKPLSATLNSQKLLRPVMTKATLLSVVLDKVKELELPRATESQMEWNSASAHGLFAAPITPMSSRKRELGSLRGAVFPSVSKSSVASRLAAGLGLGFSPNRSSAVVLDASLKSE